MKYVRVRKPRGVKQDGTPSYDFCRGCYHPGCDPMALSPLMEAKISGRLRSGRCPACGKLVEYCSCKSGAVSRPVMRTHNNKKERREEELRVSVVDEFNCVCRKCERRDDIPDDLYAKLYSVLHGIQSRRPDRKYTWEIQQLKELMRLTDVFSMEDRKAFGRALSFLCYESR